MSSLTIINRRIPPKRSKVYDTYWRFAEERQNVFFRKFNNEKYPWTKDSILQTYKFTNVYRVTDKVSQYLIRNVITSDNHNPNDVIFRIILFKLFNKIETWELLEGQVGKIQLSTYNFDTYNRILSNALNSGISIYSGAYIMASGNNCFGYRLKHQNHLRLLELIIEDNLPDKITSLKTMESLYQCLLNYPMIGPFLAYQFAIDINYSKLTNFSEMDFVKAGPGAKDGIRKCFESLGEFTEEDTIRYMAENQFIDFNQLHLNFKDLFGRPLQLIDCQNLFCEVDKYSRLYHPEISGITNRKRIKQKYKVENSRRIDYCFPESWNLTVSFNSNSHG